jgi:hypothetical protein
MISLLMPYLKFQSIDKCQKQKMDLHQCIHVYKEKQKCVMYLDLLKDCMKKHNK